MAVILYQIGKFKIILSINMDMTFLEFLNESKFCVLNGRFNELKDNYTSVSRKRKSVVDFICIPQDIFNMCRNFSVITVQSSVDAHAMHGLLGERSLCFDNGI